MRAIIRLSQAIFIVAGIILIFGHRSWFPDYYRPVPMGLLSLFYAFLIELPRWWYPPSRGRTLFQAFLGIDLLLSGLGSLGLWDARWGIIHYDKVVHTVFSGTMVLFGTELFRQSFRWSRRKSIWIAFMIVALSGVAWEFVEFWFSAAFHIGYFGHLFDTDSRHDIYANICGAVTGILLSKI